MMTPKSTKLSVIREISGHTTIRDFCHYLMHLRTSKLADSTKIKRFTLNFEEFQNFPNVSSVTHFRTYVQTRPGTQERLDSTRNKLNLEQIRTKMGPIKSYTYTLATSNNWGSADFQLEKNDLREMYKVHAKIPKKYLKMSKIALYWFLNFNSKFPIQFNFTPSLNSTI